jgi:hypothetical protein
MESELQDCSLVYREIIKALKSLLAFDTNDTSLLEESLRRAFVTTKQLDTSCGRFFEVVTDITSRLLRAFEPLPLSFPGTETRFQRARDNP